jgi:hypothetical protein
MDTHTPGGTISAKTLKHKGVGLRNNPDVADDHHKDERG